MINRIYRAFILHDIIRMYALSGDGYRQEYQKLKRLLTTGDSI